MAEAKRNASVILVVVAVTVALSSVAVRSSAVSAGENAAGILSGIVTRSPIAPVERPGRPSSAPAIGVKVTVSSSDGKEVASAVTDNEGRYSISLPPGNYIVSVTPGPVGRPGAPVEVTVATGAEITQDLRIDTRIR